MRFSPLAVHLLSGALAVDIDWKAFLCDVGAARFGVVVENRLQPLFDFWNRHALARRIILDLITLYFAHTKVFSLRVGKVKSAHATPGIHRKALGKPDFSATLNIENLPENRLLGVIGLGGIPRRWPDAPIFFPNQIFFR